MPFWLRVTHKVPRQQGSGNISELDWLNNDLKLEEVQFCIEAVIDEGDATA
jgi:hypothetical protein